MKQDPARNPSALRERASAHRAMALAALRADSSLSARLRRYNHHMSVARALEADAAQHDPRTPLAWPTAGKARHADPLNLRAHLRHMRAPAALEVLGGVQP
ncbi:hypothetical protein [Azotobacter beijerinckii]|uniref:hypothetical protein n=1 Tax=Azotobacter beijerinckii TaxID=170623 RepID=UPI002952C559|nr:hypothetical protein [Azotobacter beijerinckii]MDV7211071.1 hypothetical protein [Azotobacter beijerinckii]